MRPLAAALSGLLSLALILSGGAMAGHARAVAGYLDLCRDGAAVTVAVDARGEPVDPFADALPHCAACLAPAAIVPTPVTTGPPCPLRVSRAISPVIAPAVQARSRHTLPLARAPPAVAT